jgi:hypothetical protein
MLQRQLERARGARNPLPRIVPIHLSMPHVDELKDELRTSGAVLGMDLEPAYEDMIVDATG